MVFILEINQVCYYYYCASVGYDERVVFDSAERQQMERSKGIMNRYGSFKFLCIYDKCQQTSHDIIIYLVSLKAL